MKYKWYVEEGDTIAHSIFCGWDGPERYDYYYTRCHLPVGYDKKKWKFLGISEDGNEVSLDIPRCKKCEKIITKNVQDRERAVEWQKQQKEKEKKRKAREKEKKKLEAVKQHAKLVKDIRDLIDSKKRSSVTLVEQIIRMVRNATPKS